MNLLVTGAAGFIGMHVARRLLEGGHRVATIDNLNDYYNPELKAARLEVLRSHEGFRFYEASFGDAAAVARVFAEGKFQRVIHLGAQAGVRYSLDNPLAYAESNITGFLNILEGCRRHEIEHLVYASSSSVYGLNRSMPFSVHNNVDHPISLYAASKKANELMAHTYSHLYQLPTTGLRFFTVYGPWGRPDMTPFLFTKAILAGRPVKLFNHGRNRRGFTFIDDIVEGVLRVAERPAVPDPAWDGAAPDPGSSSAPWRVYNIGSASPVAMTEFVSTLEACLGRQAVVEKLPPAPGDMEATAAEVSELREAVGFAPGVSLEDGLRRFVKWFHEHEALCMRC